MVAVLGAGVIGSGVAQTFAMHGYHVLLIDLSLDALKRAEKEIRNSIRYLSMMDKDMRLSVEQIMGRITFTTAYDGLEHCEYVVENIIEDEKEKTKLYEKLKRVCSESCIFIVNTSCIPITRLSCHVCRKENMIGVHFMNPVPLKDTVEVIMGRDTSGQTLGRINVLLHSIGKEGVVVNDSPGFVSNRLSHLFMNEAAKIVEEGVATCEAVDTIFKKCFGHAMGPFETADLIGIDTVVNSIQVLEQEYHDERFQCSALLTEKVKEGKLGRKTKEGFYQY